MKLGQWMGAAAVVTLGIACGGNGGPSFEVVSHQFYKSYCARIHQCLKQIQGNDLGEASFTKADPLGETDCVDQNYKEFSALNSLEATCTQERWDTCSKDLETATCVQSTTTPAIGLKIPDSCKGC
jgi:hypothetical protein